ncbi:MAG TPA: hypothetical protein VIG40_06325, partial [Tissierellaceae bacterium]
IILSIIYILRMGYKLDYKQVMLESEKSLHYGPSVEMISKDIKGGKIIISEYDNYISFNRVEKVLLLFYKNGDGRQGVELSKEPQLSYVWTEIGRSKRYSSKRDIVVYGRVNDTSVKKISLILSNGDISEDVIIDNGYFIGIIPWEIRQEKVYFQNLLAYDESGEEVFKGVDINF